MRSYRFQLVSSLSKVFPDAPPKPFTGPLSALRGEPVSFQVAYFSSPCGGGDRREPLRFEVDAGEDVTARLYQVGLVPGAYVCNELHDEDYLTTAPGLFPDVLAPMPEEGVRDVPGQWRAVWVELSAGKGLDRPVTVRALGHGGAVWESQVALHVAQAALPPQRTLHTEWFHADCLADYYRVPVFSEEHWALMERFAAMAAAHGINTLLVPLFTPPLDTAVGSERTTVQLLDVVKEGTGWRFGFERLERYLAMLRRAGITTFEMSHLFTQWGARHAPKIIAQVDGESRRVFGWETDAHGEEYESFLAALLPRLRDWLREHGALEQTIFHVSDEPVAADLDSYRRAKECIARALGSGCRIYDAMSDFGLFQQGAIDHPVVANNHIEPFLEAKVPGLWTYYCTSQSVDVSNRFLAQPLSRCRVLGVQLYLYRIEGFLHWGYNFYNTQQSLAHINPFAVTDAGESFPSGDSFIVYPGEDGQPLASLRLKAMDEAMRDVRALEALEALAGRDLVEELVRGEAGMRITFRQYPRQEEFLLRLRRRVNEEIERRSQ